MVRLVPMNNHEFEAFMVISMRDQAGGQVQAGTWIAEDADDNIKMLRAQFLPDGLNTARHHFYTIEDPTTGNKVGGLWFMENEIEGQNQFFVLDIQIDQAQRRQGYGTQAFYALEELARHEGVPTISLHVFEHNLPAREMYRKLGYEGPGNTLAKNLDR